MNERKKAHPRPHLRETARLASPGRPFKAPEVNFRHTRSASTSQRGSGARDRARQNLKADRQPTRYDPINELCPIARSALGGSLPPGGEKGVKNDSFFSAGHECSV